MATIDSDFDMLRLEFVKAFVACRADADRKAVHAVRMNARRLEAVVCKILEDHPKATALHKKTKKTLCLLGRIRKAAGLVRDLDVHRMLAEDLKSKVLRYARGTDRDDRLREYGLLEEYLEHKRQRTTAKLQKSLTVTELKLERALEKTCKEFKLLKVGRTTYLSTAKRWTLQQSCMLDRLDEDNLHDYRKQTKSARYLAELEPGSSSARRLARELHTVQDAIGEWHDFDLLSQRARHVLGKHASISVELNKKRDGAYVHALRVANQLHRGGE